MGDINKASRAAKIGRTTHYWWLKTDPTYPARFEEARQRAIGTLADDAVRRARDGRSGAVKPAFARSREHLEDSRRCILQGHLHRARSGSVDACIGCHAEHNG
jgi:hypothetical protein